MTERLLPGTALHMHLITNNIAKAEGCVRGRRMMMMMEGLAPRLLVLIWHEAATTRWSRRRRTSNSIINSRTITSLSSSLVLFATPLTIQSAQTSTSQRQFVTHLCIRHRQYYYLHVPPLTAQLHSIVGGCTGGEREKRHNLSRFLVTIRSRAYSFYLSISSQDDWVLDLSRICPAV